ncbi:acyloxyacyl hydrolase [Algoriphagus namhaensis]
MRTLLGFIFLLPFVSTFVLAQNSVERFGLETQYGWILAHNPELAEVAKSNPVSLGLSAQWMRTSRQNWEACNCFHYLGLNLSVIDFQNPTELGRAWNLAGNFEPILFRSGRWTGSLSMGIGVSYLTRVYDEVENPRNTFFSAPISFLLFLTPKITYDLHPEWALQASLTYNHISNGGQRQPNRGMNFPMLGLGLLHYTRRAELPRYKKADLIRKWAFYADLGFNTRDDQGGGRAPNITLTAATYRQLTGVLALGGGLEVAKDFSLPTENSRVERVIPGVFLENHFLFGKFDFSQRMVRYLARPAGYQEDHQFYQRYVLSYRLGKNFRLGAGLKAHGHVAEYMDFRVGWNF